MREVAYIPDRMYDVEELHDLLGEIGDLADVCQQVPGVTDKMDDRLERAMGRRLYAISVKVQPYRTEERDRKRSVMKWC